MMAFIVGFFGLFVGSFLNVLIDRLPQGKDVISGRSKCDYCGKTLRWYELIPVISFLSQGAKCRRCHKALSWQYPGIELLTGMVFFTITYRIIDLSISLPLLIVAGVFIVITMADFKYQIIPDSMVIILGIAAVWLEFATSGMQVLPVKVGAGIGSFLFFLLLWIATKGKGMGFGDVKLAFPLGLLLGFPDIVFAIYVAFLTGASAGILLLLSRNKTLKSRIAFGPFLILGAVCVLVFPGVFTAIVHTLF